MVAAVGGTSRGFALQFFCGPAGELLGVRQGGLARPGDDVGEERVGLGVVAEVGEIQGHDAGDLVVGPGHGVERGVEVEQLVGDAAAQVAHVLQVEVAAHHREDQLAVNGFGGVTGQHAAQVRVAQVLAQRGRQRLVGVEHGLPLGQRVLVAVGAHIVPRHEHAVLRQQPADGPHHPVDLGDVVAGGMVDHQVDALEVERERVDVRLHVLQVRPRRSGLGPGGDQQVLRVVGAHTALGDVVGQQASFHPAVAAVQRQQAGERAAVVLAEMLHPAHVRVAGGAPVELVVDGRDLVPVPGSVVHRRVAGDDRALAHRAWWPGLHSIRWRLLQAHAWRGSAASGSMAYRAMASATVDGCTPPCSARAESTATTTWPASTSK